MTTVPLMFAQEDVEFGGKPGIADDFAYNNNVMQASVNIRMGFLRKVYGLLSLQFLLTVVVSGVCMYVPVVRNFIHTNQWLMSCALLLSMVVLIALFIKRRDSPANLILLATFTVIQAYSVGVILTFYDQYIVLQALFLTVTVVLGLSAYTFQTKRDFSSFGFGLFTVLCCLLAGSLLQLFVQSTVLEFVISWAGAVLFCFFIIFDTQMMMEKLSPEEYILATINLYLDIINLFIYILRILEATRRH
ncbi:protein lifeguard 4-like [Periplaneta americana]|uniref:protein lifeguard 4-like n=1 Tax=Periplaneta americana TaxID=6978 RepID=UPI0037E88611